MEKGDVLPGQLVFGTDSHSTSYGGWGLRFSDRPACGYFDGDPVLSFCLVASDRFRNFHPGCLSSMWVESHTNRSIVSVLNPR